MAVGGTFGAVAARKVRMTAMPQMVAEFHNRAPLPGTLHWDISTAIMLSAIIGSISFAGSMVAFAKLQELIGGRPIVYAGQQIVNALVFAVCLAAGIALMAG